jgi:hypothetical protein
MHVRHPKIARRWDAEVKADKKPAKPAKLVSKGVPKGLLAAAGKPTSSSKTAVYARRRLEAHQAGRAVSGVTQWKAAKLPPAAFPHLANQNISAGVRARRQANLALSKQWGANNSVSKAMSRDDRRTLTAAGVGAAGLGTVRVGGEMHHRAITSVTHAQRKVDVAAGKVTNAIAARNRTRGQPKPIGGAAGGRKILKEPGKRPRNPLNRRDWIANLERGHVEAQGHLADAKLAQPTRITRAMRTKKAGLLIAGAGALGTVHYARAASRNRYASLGY